MATVRYLAIAALGLALGCASLVYSGAARADATAWTQVSGGGVGWQMGEDDDFSFSPMMAIDVGAGSDPNGLFILGGLFRVLPIFDGGADLALLARFATRGFQSDLFGFAFDAGVYQRFWGSGSTGFQGEAILGGPLGLQLSAIGSIGTGSARSVGFLLGIDFVRLTIGRGHLLEWWPNPSPAPATAPAAGSLSGYSW